MKKPLADTESEAETLSFASVCAGTHANKLRLLTYLLGKGHTGPTQPSFDCLKYL